MKFWPTTYAEYVRKAENAEDARWLGRQREISVRYDWDQIALEVMADGLRAKFTQNLVARERLLSTGNAKLVYPSRDKYWGDGIDRTGKNMLGTLVMQLRDELSRS